MFPDIEPLMFAISIGFNQLVLKVQLSSALAHLDSSSTDYFNVLSARLRLQAKYYTEQGPLRSDAKRLIEVHIYRNMEDDVRIQVDKLNLENSINPRKKSEVDSGSPRSTNNANMGTSSNFSPFATHLRQQCSIPLWP